MLDGKLSVNEWRQEVDTLFILVNRQYRQISENNISLKWLSSPGHCEVVIKFPTRECRILFEGVISEMLQGVCFVLDNTRLRWMYC